MIHDDAVATLKEFICKAPVLRYFDSTKQRTTVVNWEATAKDSGFSTNVSSYSTSGLATQYVTGLSGSTTVL